MFLDLERKSERRYQGGIGDRAAAVPEWQAVHERLRRNAHARAELDASEIRELRRAEQLQIWRRFGCPTLLAYLERELGYGPRDARDRLRVARALAELPAIERALTGGTLKYTAVRELTRVAVRANEDKWLARAAGKNLRQIEELVSGRRRGDDPDAPVLPEHRLSRIPFEDLTAETCALIRQARIALAEEHGEHLSDDQFLATLCRRVLEPREESAAAQPSHQIAVTTCEHCKRAWQHGGGRLIELTPAAIERAACDANHIGSLDADQPERAKADIPPATRRLVMHRDRGRCTVPGCRSARGLDLHHIVHREHGGDHAPSNLTVTCFAHHQQSHAGLLEISGRAPDQLRFVRRDPGVVECVAAPRGHAERAGTDAPPSVAASSSSPDAAFNSRPDAAATARPDAAATAKATAACAPADSGDPGARFRRIAIETQTRDALVGLGFRPGEARAAIEQAKAHVGHDEATLEGFLRVALSKAPKPRRG